jgi:RNA 2',3'-cyclic 3'-phosphodiesterase
MPRLFVGLDIPPRLALRLSQLQGGLIGGRLVDPADFHITLRFIGDVDNHLADEIDGMLQGIRRPPLALRTSVLDGLGGDKPHSLVMRVEASRALVDLQAEIERAMRRAGVGGDKRRFEPHITFARVKGMPGVDIARFLQAQGFIEPFAFEAGRIVLYSSRDSIGGGPYVIEATYPLDG